MTETADNILTWSIIGGLMIILLPFVILKELLKSIPLLICVGMLIAAAYCMITTPEATIGCVFVMMFFGYGLTQEL